MITVHLKTRTLPTKVAELDVEEAPEVIEWGMSYWVADKKQNSPIITYHPVGPLDGSMISIPV